MGVKDGWAVRKLGDVCEKTVNIKWQEYENQVFQYIDLSSVSRTTLTINETSKITSKNAPSRAKKIIRQNDVIFATTRPTLKRVTIVPVKFDNQICSTGYSVLRNNSDFILPKYIFYFLRSEVFMQRMENLQRGTSYPAVTDKDVKSTQIPIPPLTEQKQIVALLDQAFAAIDQAIANLEKNIQNAQELFQSKLNDVFSQRGEGWVEKSLGGLGTLTSSKRIFKKEYVPQGIPFYRSKEIKELSNNKPISLELFITKERYEEIKNKFGTPQKGDILLTAVGTIGEMYVVQSNEEQFYFKDGNIMWLKGFKDLNSYYLRYALTNFVEQLKAMSRGSAYSALTIEKLKKYSIPVPDIDQQQIIVNLLDDLKKKQLQIIDSYNIKKESLEELKKSILQKAFNGELT